MLPNSQIAASERIRSIPEISEDSHHGGRVHSVTRRIVSESTRISLFLLTFTLAGCHQPPSAAPPEEPENSLFYFSDDFERANGALGSAWTDGNSTSPDFFEPLGIYDGGVVVADPESRPGVYGPTPPKSHPPEAGRIYPGIGCAYMDTGTTTVRVKTVWSGNYGTGGQPANHSEGAPLLYVSPESRRYGFGAWPSELYGQFILFIGYIGGPPETFEVVTAVVVPGGHKDGTNREIELRADTPGQVTVWVDGKQIELGGGIGLKPVEVDSTMIDSTLHGFAVDSHFVNPRSDIPRTKAIESIEIREVK